MALGNITPQLNRKKNLIESGWICYIFQRQYLRGAVQKKNSIFVDIIQIKVDLPPSYPIFDKFIFDKVLIMLTSLPPLEFLTKIMKF